MRSGDNASSEKGIGPERAIANPIHIETLNTLSLTVTIGRSIENRQSGQNPTLIEKSV
jgi:hypothetical protein